MKIVSGVEIDDGLTLAATGAAFGGGEAATSRLPSAGKPEVPFVVEFMLAVVVACLELGDVAWAEAPGGLNDPAGRLEWECDGGLRGRV
jgi:hypothetical protein